MILIEVDPNPMGPWDSDTEVILGSFDTPERTTAFARQVLVEERWDTGEIDLMPASGSFGSTFQLVP